MAFRVLRRRLCHQLEGIQPISTARCCARRLTSVSSLKEALALIALRRVLASICTHAKSAASRMCQTCHPCIQPLTAHVEKRCLFCSSCRLACAESHRSVCCPTLHSEQQCRCLPLVKVRWHPGVAHENCCLDLRLALLPLPPPGSWPGICSEEARHDMT